jgi:hypothetical protein
VLISYLSKCDTDYEVLLERTFAAGRPTICRQIEMTFSRLHRVSRQTKEGVRWTSVRKKEKIRGA